MRFAGIGLLIIGALVAILGGLATEGAGSLPALIAGGFMFVSGSVFVASSAILDALKRNG